MRSVVASPHGGQIDYAVEEYTEAICVLASAASFLTHKEDLLKTCYSLKTVSLPEELLATPSSTSPLRCCPLTGRCCLVFPRQGEIYVSNFRNAAHPRCKRVRKHASPAPLPCQNVVRSMVRYLSW